MSLQIDIDIDIDRTVKGILDSLKNDSNNKKIKEIKGHIEIFNIQNHDNHGNINTNPYMGGVVKRLNEELGKLESLQTGGRKNIIYKSTHKKIKIYVNKKIIERTVYKNSKNIEYVKINKKYVLLSKCKKIN